MIHDAMPLLVALAWVGLIWQLRMRLMFAVAGTCPRCGGRQSFFSAMYFFVCRECWRDAHPADLHSPPAGGSPPVHRSGGSTDVG